MFRSLSCAGIYFALLFIWLISFSGCWILPTKIANTIYFEVPDRSEDLVPRPKSLFTELSSNEVVLSLDESEDPLEVGSRQFFSSGFLVSKSKPNSMEALEDGSMIVGYQDGSLYVFKADPSASPGKLIAKHFAQGTSPILAIKVSPDGKYLAVSQFSVVTILDLKELRIAAQLHRVKGRILDLAWSPDSTQLLMGRANGDVFSWSLEDNIHYTLDSHNVLEIYETQASPVVDIVFHPSGRAFFVALENGSLFLIRLVKTELELGIREEGKEFEMDRGSYVQKFADIEGGISKLKILPERDELLVVSFSGAAYYWRIRGLKKIDSINIGSEASTFSVFLDQEKSSVKSDLIMGVGRSLRLKLSCLKVDYNKTVQPTKEVFIDDPETVENISAGSSNSDFDDASLIQELKSEIKKTEKNMGGSLDRVGGSFNLVMESAKYAESIAVMELNSRSDMLWVGGKSGTISAFYLGKYLEVPANSSKIEAICK